MMWIDLLYIYAEYLKVLNTSRFFSYKDRKR